MQSPSAAILVVISAPLLGGGCLGSVQNQSSDPQAINIDSFEKGEAISDDPRFTSWEFYAYNPNGPLPNGAFVTSGVVSPGYDSNYALELEWEVIDILDGMPNYPGVGTGVGIVSPLDLTSYDRIQFAQQYSNPGTCTSVQQISVTFACSEYNASFTASVPLSASWTTSTILFTSLVQSSNLGQATTDIGACFKVIDGLHFDCQVDLPDGGCASGALLLDDISIP